MFAQQGSAARSRDTHERDTSSQRWVRRGSVFAAQQGRGLRQSLWQVEMLDARP